MLSDILFPLVLGVGAWLIAAGLAGGGAIIAVRSLTNAGITTVTTVGPLGVMAMGGLAGGAVGRAAAGAASSSARGAARSHSGYLN